MLTCGASGAPLFSPSVRVTAGYRGEERGDNKRDNAHRQKGSAVGENSNSAFYIVLRLGARPSAAGARQSTRHPFAQRFASVSRRIARIARLKCAQCPLKTLCSPFHCVLSIVFVRFGQFGRGANFIHWARSIRPFRLPGSRSRMSSTLHVSHFAHSRFPSGEFEFARSPSRVPCAHAAQTAHTSCMGNAC
jgi:hypothetical protein